MTHKRSSKVTHDLDFDIIEDWVKSDKKEEPYAKNIAIVSFWKKGVHDLECYQQFSVLDPLYFPNENQIG